MASRKVSAKDLDEVRKLAERWGKIIARKAFGESGPGLDVDLDAMEEVAVAAAQGLTQLPQLDENPRDFWADSGCKSKCTNPRVVENAM